MTSATAVGAVSARIDALVRVVQDWPQPGITFRDVTPLLADPQAFEAVIDAMVGQIRSTGPVEAVLGVEARGFIVGTAIAMKLGAGFVPVRKAGKLPGEVYSARYDLEYGTAAIELPSGVVTTGMPVVVVDDVLATGGTLAAAIALAEQAGAKVVASAVMIEIAGLGGRQAAGARPCHIVRSY